jgi:hypothetical protein
LAYIGVVVIEVVVTDVFREWYEALISDEQESIFRVVSLLERLGVALGFPYSSAIEGSPHSRFESYESSIEAGHSASFRPLIREDKQCCLSVETKPVTSASTRR